MKVAILNNKFSIFYWKKISSRTFTASEKSMPGFKASKDKMTLLLRDNVAHLPLPKP